MRVLNGQESPSHPSSSASKEYAWESGVRVAWRRGPSWSGCLGSPSLKTQQRWQAGEADAFQPAALLQAALEHRRPSCWQEDTMASSPELGFVPGSSLECPWSTMLWALQPSSPWPKGPRANLPCPPLMEEFLVPMLSSALSILQERADQGTWVGLDHTSHRPYVWKLRNVFKIIISFLHQEKMVT